MAFLEPDRYFSRLSMIDIDKDIVACGFTHVLLDIDNTILTRDTHEIPRDVSFWLSRARNAGLEFCLLSNNWHAGVYEIAEKLKLPIVAKAVKPLPPAFLIALSKIGAKRATTLVIGDQLVTDVLGAHFLGMKAYMLKPLVEQDLKHTLILRNLEKAIMGDRQPEGVPAEFSDLAAEEGSAYGIQADDAVGDPVKGVRAGGFTKGGLAPKEPGREDA